MAHETFKSCGSSSLRLEDPQDFEISYLDSKYVPMLFFSIYNLTFCSFVLAFLHFFTECVIFKTAELTNMGVLSPLFVSGKII